MIGYLSMAVLSLSIGLGLYLSNIIPIASFSFDELKLMMSSVSNDNGGASSTGTSSYLDRRCGLVKHLAGDNPFTTETSSLSSSIPIWGSYRPGIYFGMKQRTSPSFMNTGIMWTDERGIRSKSYRHQTDPNELSRFEWTIHDGSTFGVHEIEDKEYGMNLNASFIMQPVQDTIWSQKLDINTPNNNNNRGDNNYNLFFYFGAECDVHDIHEQMNCLSTVNVKDWTVERVDGSNAIEITGSSTLTGNFKLVINVDSGDGGSSSDGSPEIHYWAPSMVTASALKALRGELSHSNSNSHKSRRRKDKELIEESIDAWSFEETRLSDVVADDAGTVVVQVAWSGSTTLSITASLTEQIQENDSNNGNSHGNANSNVTPTQKEISQAFEAAITKFNDRFDSIFRLTTDNGFTSEDRRVGVRALSAMLGGIGHFTGRPLMGDAENEILDEENSNKSNEIDTIEEKNTIYGKIISLLTCTPSRTAFPRGFLWDEGFHQLLVSSWSPTITMKVLNDWMAAMHFPTSSTTNDIGDDIIKQCIGGWIPREMILGAEASSRVPSEFITQRPNIANPPTLLLVVEKLLKMAINTTDSCSSNGHSNGSSNSKCESEENTVNREEILTFVRDLYPSLHTWIQWFLISQAGPASEPYTYRWRGRTSKENKLAPNTLASGLDDYPRSLRPSSDELHLDLLCWMAAAARAMHSIEILLKEADMEIPIITTNSNTNTNYNELYQKLLESLETNHWNEDKNIYADVGWQQEGEGHVVDEVMIRCAPSDDPQGSDAVDISVPATYIQKLMAKAHAAGQKEPPEGFCPPEYPTFLGIHGDGYGGMRTLRVFRVASPNTTPLSRGHIPRIGYLSLYPLLLQLLSADSSRLESILDIIENDKQLWSPHGLRSISKEDPFYREANAPGDEPYWRGPIWININYLTLSSLYQYSKIDGPYQSRIQTIYTKLRHNILETVIGEYRRTNFFWEQYDERTGEGMRNHPFSGWTALILNVMAESY